MPGNPQPIVALGSYLINVASLSIDQIGRGTLSNPKYGVQATFTTHTPTSPTDQKVQDFTFTDPSTGKTITGSYDYSWGNKDVNGFIIGDGSGGYYIITSAVPGSSSSTIDGKILLDPQQAKYAYSYNYYLPWSVGNQFALLLNNQQYLFRQDNNGTATNGSISNSEQFTFDTCFLAGSLINTPEGPKEVETLKRGDMILTYDPLTGQTLPQAITWAGQGHVQIDASQPMDMAGYPVRIRQNALADGIPSTDLLVTAEHCLFLEGRFIPARMMVNGRSIHFDITEEAPSNKQRAHNSRYAIFHIETEKHSIIFSNGALTESYLDTGNRHNVLRSSQKNENNNVIEYDFSSKSLSWQDDAAAPLDTTQDFVAPLYHTLLRRAETLQFPIQHSYKAENLSEDPAFHLITDQGEVLHEQRMTNDYKIFSLPSGTRSVTLHTKTGRPYDVHGPFIDDRRALGVLIGEIIYFQAGQAINIEAHLNEAELAGWFDREAPSMRWTAGAATLPLPFNPHNHEPEESLLAIQYLAGGPYPVTPPSPLPGKAHMTNLYQLHKAG